MFSEYQIRASFIKALKQGLEEMEVPGYTVLARNPPNMTYDTDCVLIDKINMKRQGFQQNAYEWIDEKLLEKDEWIEEWTWQLSILHRRKVEDTIESMTGEDVGARLMMWLNSSRGARAMRGRTDVPFAPVFTSQLRNRAYQDDSEIYQIECSFDFRMIVLQVHAWDVKEITNWYWTTHPI